MKTAQEFVDALQAAFDVRFAKPGVLNAPLVPRFKLVPGRRYDKLMADNAVYCFVDKLGNIYKAASWKAPAKHVRATLAQITPEFVTEIAKAGYATTAWLYIR